MNKVMDIAKKVGFVFAAIILVPVFILIGLAALAFVITFWYAFVGIVTLVIIVTLLYHMWTGKLS